MNFNIINKKIHKIFLSANSSINLYYYILEYIIRVKARATWRVGLISINITRDQPTRERGLHT